MGRCAVSSSFDKLRMRTDLRYPVLRAFLRHLCLRTLLRYLILSLSKDEVRALVDKGQLTLRQRREVRLDHRRRHVGQRRRLPFRRVVLVDQQRANAFEEIMALHEALDHAEFHAHAVFEIQLGAVRISRSDTFMLVGDLVRSVARVFCAHVAAIGGERRDESPRPCRRQSSGRCARARRERRVAGSVPRSADGGVGASRVSSAACNAGSFADGTKCVASPA